jgi:hypothetical protein
MLRLDMQVLFPFFSLFLPALSYKPGTIAVVRMLPILSQLLLCNLSLEVFISPSWANGKFYLVFKTKIYLVFKTHLSSANDTM